MAVFISMLRAINVGGHNKIKMDALRALYQSLGLKGVQSHLQSGNVIFSSQHSNSSRLAATIEEGIETAFGFRPRIILRTLPELKAAIARNPFTDGKERDPARLLVMFLLEAPSQEAKQLLQQLDTAPEELHITGPEVYLYYPAGAGQSKLTGALIEKKLKTLGTARNWNTVTKLVEIAEAY